MTIARMAMAAALILNMAGLYIEVMVALKA
jgi:hypothetical protein